MTPARNIKSSMLKWRMLHVYIGTAAMVLIICIEGLTCPGNQFACTDQTMCIPTQKFCDGITDCRDGSDEPYWTVNSNYSDYTTICRRGKDSFTPRLCILPSQLRAQQDELCDGSACRYHEFPCADGSQCVPKSFFCDGIKNCQDGSDEVYRDRGSSNYSDVIICRKETRFCEVTTQFLRDKKAFCESKQCSKYSFACLDGSGCVRNEEFCDGKADCGDKSDEPPLRYNNITYDPSIRFCTGRGYATYIPEVEMLIKWICVLEPSLQPYENELCSGSTCNLWEFSCMDGSQCLPNDMFCDGIVQCNDGSDELYRNNSIVTGDSFTTCRGKGQYRDTTGRICMVTSAAAEILLCEDPICTKTEFSCDDGSTCIRQENFCNGKNDCRDGSDEPPLRNSSKDFAPNVTFCRQRAHRYDDLRVRSICELPPHLSTLQEDICEGSSCTSDEFSCSDGSRCIHNSLFCNGDRDCSDGSDEPPLRNYSVSYSRYDNFCRGKDRSKNGRFICLLPSRLSSQSGQLCAGASCKDDEFPCFDGAKCIPVSSFCDGTPDCIDGSDEPPLKKSNISYDHDTMFCRGRSGPFICVLPPRLVSQHELICTGSSCSTSEFPCDDGTQCVSGHVYCNRQAECMDGSDEPSERNSSESYGLDVTFCRSHERPRFSLYTVVCVLPPNHVPYADKICAGSTCQHDEFPCIDGTACLPNRYFCDSDPDCPDRSDERYFNGNVEYSANVSFCRKVNWRDSRVCVLAEGTPVNLYESCEGSACLWYEFSCDAGSRCVRKDDYCDGGHDCDDETDEPWKKWRRIDVNEILCRRKTPDYDYRYRICELPANLVPYMEELCDGRSCKANEFSCANGRKCIPGNQYCNGIRDCGDGSDELSRPERTDFTGRICHRKERQCMISKPDICNGVSLCDQAIDECLCPGDGKYLTDKTCFQCLTEPSLVLPISKLCDGVFDCHDLTDECLCSSVARPKLCENVIWDTSSTGNSNLPSIRCASLGNGTRLLVNARSVCDSRLDCPDGEDEAYCTGKEPSGSPFRGHKKLDYKCGDPDGKYATACDGIPECNDFMDEECRCDTLPEFCGFIYQYDYDWRGTSVDGIISTVCKHVESGERYILPVDVLCDGTITCEDQADERGCGARFYCTDEPTPSIPIEKKCDKQADCDNASDEEGCPHFSCKDDGNLQYISRDNVCDGIKDCKSGIDECQPGCIESAFSDEKSMITSKAILALSWIISLGAVIGCTAVIVTTMQAVIKPMMSDNVASTSRRTKLISRLILSLSFSDLLVGIYAFSISIKASQTDSDYCQVDREWRSSSTCSALGAIMLIGSEQSVFTMVIIASHRLYSVMRPFSRPGLVVATMAVSISWFVSILLGIIPLIPHIEDYFVSSITFNENRMFKVLKYHDIQYMDKWLSLIETTTQPQDESTEWDRLKNMILDVNPNMTVAYEFGYYSSHGVCLPTFFPDPSVDRAWGYSFFLLLLNFVAFLYMLVCYVLLFRHAMVTSTAIEANSSENKNNKESRRLQRKLTRIVISDFLCWIPICIIGFLSFNGVDIPKDVYLPAGLLIVPINSGLNPLLYSDLPEIIWNKITRIVRPQPAAAPGQTEAVSMTER